MSVIIFNQPIGIRQSSKLFNWLPNHIFVCLFEYTIYHCLKKEMFSIIFNIITILFREIHTNYIYKKTLEFRNFKVVNHHINTMLRDF